METFFKINSQKMLNYTETATILMLYDSCYVDRE